MANMYGTLVALARKEPRKMRSLSAQGMLISYMSTRESTLRLRLEPDGYWELDWHPGRGEQAQKARTGWKQIAEGVGPALGWDGTLGKEGVE